MNRDMKVSNEFALVVDWKVVLEDKLVAMGEDPSNPQCDVLIDWVMENVPKNKIEDVAFGYALPAGVASELYIRAKGF